MAQNLKHPVLFLCLLIPLPAFGQLEFTEDDYGRAEQLLSRSVSAKVYHRTLTPNWLEGDRFWYRHTAPEQVQYMFVDPDAGEQRPLFNHDRLAGALAELLNEDFTATRLSLPGLEVEGGNLSFTRGDQVVTCDTETSRCTAAPGPPESAVPRAGVRSPDGKLAAFRRDNNLWVHEVATGDETQLTFDGEEDFGYATNNAGWVRSDRPVVLWSPDSRKIATFQHDGRNVGEMYMVTTGIGRSELEAWKYPLPQDSVIFMIHRVVIHLDGPRIVRLQMPPDPHRGTTTDHIAGWDGTFLDVRWSEDASQLAFISSSRDHKEAQLRVADPETGLVRDVLRETVDTYYESGVDAENWDVFFDTGEVLWYSERSNWGHLYLYELSTGTLIRQVTSGPWAVQQLRRVDRNNRQLYFTGAGREDGNPYYQYLYRINMDGSDLRLLTPDSAHHVFRFSPSGEYFVDTWSTPVMPQQHALRRSDGSWVAGLEAADISELEDHGWQPPMPFTTMARDDSTTLYGLMYRPSDFDPSKSYPVLNYLYPGPQSGSVGTRSFVPARGDKQAIAELGFIVVEVDAMGTPGRSKSFHDAYYGNMGDNGLPDQISTIRQLAARHDWMDLDRVGIWGHSGGGFAAAGAILRYPDFYKVAVSGAGNHDNRNYEDDWGEKWQGLLEIKPDGTTNYDNQSNILLAPNLQGKLLLAHGLMDDNVPASNTLALVEALVAANKDFDLLIFPSGTHGFGRARNYWMRKRWDYFVRHLLDATPPKEYEFGRQPIRVAQPTG